MTMSKNPQNAPLKPGDKAPHSGLYEEVGPRGGHTGKEITGVKGKTLPPTSKPGNGFSLVDPAKNGAGEG
ncbi:YjzC family protein [Nocardia sp. GAS34]|uniref:YjzC family protein n=1 Tax=unclassified Nocardia TaxID=2637762 RepID=UPI003D1F2E3E